MKIILNAEVFFIRNVYDLQHFSITIVLHVHEPQIIEVNAEYECVVVIKSVACCRQRQ